MTATTATVTECPKCGTKGKTVKPVTVRALLKDEYTTEVAVPEQSNCQSGCTPSKGNTGWRFCDSPDCDLVYFGEQNGVVFTKDQLSVSVGVKERTGERPLCYCFGHSVATIKEDLVAKGRSDALEDIRRKMKDPGCRCETENPSGSCCLGSVARGIETAKAELGRQRPRGNKLEIISKMGAVLSAVMATSCCWLPLLLLAFGVSGAGIAGAMEAYRPLFIVLTFGFLGLAFYTTYKPRKGASAGEDCCAAHDCCAAPKERAKRRFNLMAFNKAMLWVVTVMAVAFLFFPSYMRFFLTWGESDEPAANNPLVQTTAFAVKGMSCEGCSVLVEKAIKKVPGVLAVKVDYDKKQAIVSTEACCPVPVKAILQAMERAGYQGADVHPGQVPVSQP